MIQKSNKIFWVVLLVVCFTSIRQLQAQLIEVPVINYVTVAPQTQRVEISWQINSPSLIDGFVVKRQIFGQTGVVDGSFNTVETINDPNQTTYIDTSTIYGAADPANRAEVYRIAAFKNNGGTIEFGNMSPAVNSIRLYPVAFDPCLLENSLSWSNYNGFAPSVSNYNIYYYTDANSSPILLQSITNGDTSLVQTHIQVDTIYYYFVEAFSSSSTDTAYSNIRSVSTVIPGMPQIMNADFATIEQLNQTDLSFTLDPNATVDRYVLLKSDSINGTFDTLATYPPGTDKITYSDYINSAQQIAFYKVIALNSCDVLTAETNIASNIVLEAYPATDGSKTNILQWTTYRTWLGGVDYFEIYRSVDGGAYNSIVQLSASENTFTDDITDLIAPDYGGQASQGHFCYYVVATEGSGNPYGIMGTSRSNISCAHQETVLWLPNAFNPNSGTEQNRTFKPVISFVNDYSLIIYDRNGSVVFKSADPLEGWDGRTSGGDLLKQGTFVFLLKYRTKNNKFVEKTGQINLIY